MTEGLRGGGLDFIYNFQIHEAAQVNQVQGAGTLSQGSKVSSGFILFRLKLGFYLDQLPVRVLKGTAVLSSGAGR